MSTWSACPNWPSALDCTVTYLLGLTEDPTRWEPDRSGLLDNRPVARPAVLNSPGVVGQPDSHWILGPDIPTRPPRR